MSVPEGVASPRPPKGATTRRPGCGVTRGLPAVPSRAAPGPPRGRALSRGCHARPRCGLAEQTRSEPPASRRHAPRRTSRNTQVNRYTAAPGVSSREPASAFGTKRSQVQILSPRPTNGLLRGFIACSGTRPFDRLTAAWGESGEKILKSPPQALPRSRHHAPPPIRSSIGGTAPSAHPPRFTACNARPHGPATVGSQRDV